MRATQWVSLIVLGGVLCLSGGLFAQNAQQQYKASDVEQGRQQFRINCVLCHGADGDQVGGVKLMTGEFRYDYADSALVQLILDGIPGTPMPSTSMSEATAQTIVAYLRVSAQENSPHLAGDPAAGKAIFEGRGGCLNCHNVAGQGAHFGPDLSNIGARRRAIELESSILDPNQSVGPQNRFIRATGEDGADIRGRVLGVDSFNVQIIDSDDQVRTLDRTRISEFQMLNDSPMPSFRDRLTAQELADLVAYLTTLKRTAN